MKGFFGIYKPSGPTSHDIIDEVRQAVNIQKVGHAGTLDPLAEGVLIVAIGRENTKKLALMMGKEKEYLCLIELGKKSLTGDQEGPITIVSKKRPLLGEIESTLSELRGETMQIPHKFSAVKIKGRKAYELAREGKEVAISPKKIIIRKIEVITYSYPLLSIRVISGPGTYIRSLTEDIGIRLKTGAYLKKLKRIRIGDITEEIIKNSKTKIEIGDDLYLSKLEVTD
ncbi:MAG: tRNA pseudouridine(55) synthase TruB [Candidatus Pacebacteria bacterium]|nr:tRNA pseudouridine(55) synthase TruB [Candidatus Paceibacterota bacterium]